MITSDAIAAALSRVRSKADKTKSQVIKSVDISRADREILVRTGWLHEIIRGWYMLIRPDMADGDTTAWYANFWDFTRVYLTERFGDDYCLSAESSLDLHIDNPTVPKQVIVIAKHGTGLRTLMHDTSLMIYADPKNFPSERTKRNGINIMSLAYALCKAVPTYFQYHSRDAELALRLIKSHAEISRMILRFNLKTAASRLIGAYQFLNDDSMAEAIKNDLAAVGILINPANPFHQASPLLSSSRLTSPYAGRIQAMWKEARDSVIKHFPAAPLLPKTPEEYLHKIDEIYQYDAYNSLSIEGYQVTTQLINQVKNNMWNPDYNEQDINLKNALAAKGYYNAFQHVKKCIAQILRGENAAVIVRKNLQNWYQCLFNPSVQAGIVPPEALIGYRNDRVFIRNSRHSPPPKEAVLDAMDAFFDCLKQETHPAVNAVLGHYFFVFIHPYMDGNGRIGRFLMNVMLASGGYPWTIIRVDNRKKYISTLEKTHNNFDITDFAKFIMAEMNANHTAR